ncbi:hypothetical protein OAK19_00255 [Aureispira]|nr:hypothetical protein [Aureispira sp.]
MKKYTLLIIFLGINIAFAKIKLSDVDALTFRAGEMTTGRRSAPLPQLKCTGACTASVPKTIQCKNIGSDGLDVQWDCTAELPNNRKFGIVNVNCEGFDFPYDPYILEGSCQLQFELMYKNNTNYSDTSDIAALLLVILISVIICTICGGSGGRSGGSGGGGFWTGLGVGALAGNAYGGRRRGGRRGRWGGSRSGGWGGSRTARVGAKTTRR